VYSPDVIGHFGLAHDYYAHFTSPIRRYPDLLVHRAIRHVLRGGKASDFIYSHADMVTLGEHCSMTERRADDATRDVSAWLKTEYMQEHVGESFDGIISGVTGFGLFVELDKVYVEGLIHVTALTNDYYHFDPVRHQLKGENSGRIYRLGDKLRITVARVDLDERKIDFVLADSDNTTMPKRKPKPKTNANAAAKPANKARQAGEKPPRKAKRKTAFTAKPQTEQTQRPAKTAKPKSSKAATKTNSPKSKAKKASKKSNARKTQD
jgi:ribonuclease R